MSFSGNPVLVPVEPPFRLDLTVAVLRRFSTNVVDIVAPDGAYVRAHATATGTHVFAVRQRAPDLLEVALDRDDEPERIREIVCRTLGTQRDATHFAEAAARIPWLAGIARRMRGVRPPRYATLWEACVNAVVFQQVSIAAATAILARSIVALGSSAELALPDGRTLVARTFFGPMALLAARDETLRTAGLSVMKIATLRRVAVALVEGTLDEAVFERLASAEASARLCEIKGIGPWTAAVILLRGLGRLDVFPENDSGVARSLRALTDVEVDVAATLAQLAPEQGMLYFHLLLARLEARGEFVAT